MTTASYITLSRVFLIFPIIVFTSLQSSLFNYLALVLFIFAGLTDYLDGYIARKTNSVTELGGLLDLLADKLLISAILIWLLFLDNSILLMIPIIIIVLRELIISSLRQFALEKHKKIEVSMLGKGKTTIHLISIGLIIINPEFGNYFYVFSVFFLWVAAFISIISLMKYLKSTIKSFKV